MERIVRILVMLTITVLSLALAGCGGGGACSGVTFGGSGSGSAGESWNSSNNACGPASPGDPGANLGTLTALVYGANFENSFQKWGIYSQGTKLHSEVKPSGIATENLRPTAAIEIANKFVYFLVSQHTGTVKDEATIYGYAVDRNTNNWNAIQGTPFKVPDSFRIIPDPMDRFLILRGVDDTDFDYITVLRIDQRTGELSLAPGSPVALPLASSEEVVLGNGTFLYTLSGVFDTMYGFRINDDGSLTRLPVGPWVVEAERIAASPGGSGVIFGITMERDELGDELIDKNAYAYVVDAVGNVNETPRVQATQQAPWDLRIHPTGKFLYLDVIGQKIEGFEVGLLGVLSPITGSPFSIGIDLFGSTTNGFTPDGKYFLGNTPGRYDVRVISIDVNTGVMTLTQVNGAERLYDFAIVQ